MVRGKVQMRRIENATSRQVTFSKRRNGLLKKAYELSVLCDAEVAVIIFSQKGRLYEFSSNNIQKTIERYQKCVKEVRTNNTETEEYMQQLKHETANMAKMMELLEVSQRKILGQELGSCSFQELEETEGQLERSLSKVKARKNQLFKEQTEQLKAKERLLLEENARLSEQVKLFFFLNSHETNPPPPPFHFFNCCGDLEMFLNLSYWSFIPKYTRNHMIYFPT
ncbi:hypothetical protein L1049_020180 [Liquidambar formosana]|uniref:Uncharacterized protein n=1 Tax=Liquidambar formosana TaxID=63359 RepID=A0AAP0S6T0_LIQFO